MINIPKWDIKAEGSVQTAEEMNSVVDAVIVNAKELSILKDGTYTKTQTDAIKRDITGDTTVTVYEVNQNLIILQENELLANSKTIVDHGIYFCDDSGNIIVKIDQNGLSASITDISSIDVIKVNEKQYNII